MTPDPAAPRRRLARVARLVALAAVVVFASLFVVREREPIAAGFAGLRWELVAAAGALVVVGLAASAASWRAVLAGLGSRVPARAAARIFFLAQLGKYVPGSVWPVVAQTEMSREYHVPRARSASAALAHLLVGTVCGVVAAAVALATSSADALATYWWTIPVGVVGAAMLVPAVLNRVLGLAFRVLRRPAPEPVGGRDLLVACAWALVVWVAFGTHLWLLLLAHGLTPTPSLWLLATGAYALAWVVGFVVVVLPAGAGAREAALVLALGATVGAGDALALALVSRVLMLGGDVVLAGVAVAAARRGRQEHPLAPAP
ncbi:conserved hypothetical protein [Cellulomonas flavigena DSM 20109]|uniref:Uncharacterized protein n=1 Tax=Cellulomonas flavigena (strain ATCC 482 / DSM 20109 / BCRC 11376 / JCM 18109 / NBRC 3775 / NCIMB 8073 / NRS 134) TaxID=446466 RepID=D5UHC8_CELFN|nr:lysylphosphatidylglycerol synthase domain-containing protein [Cellulomonas flavigena]ADG75249.1 conserved hypothetical protein [Cellulomonas flavigena DSM 20109]